MQNDFISQGRCVQQVGPQSAGSGGTMSANVRLSGSLGTGACSGVGPLLSGAVAGASPGVIGADNDSGRGRSTCDADRQTLLSGTYSTSTQPITNRL